MLDNDIKDIFIKNKEILGIKLNGKLYIKNNTKLGYKLANIGNFVDLSFINVNRRGRVQETCPTLKTDDKIGIIVNKKILDNFNKK